MSLESQMETTDAEEAILTRERRALDRWSAGNPLGYVEGCADDVSYFDDIGAHRRIDGGEALRAYTSSLEGRIPAHTCTIVDPRVQLFRDVGVLTYTYVPVLEDGKASTSWKATIVYHLSDRVWRLVHAHWSTVKAT